MTVLFLSVAASALTQLYLVNVTVRDYDQLDMVPVYESSLIILQCIAGLTVMQEIGFYSLSELTGTVCGMMLCILGIYILSLKKKTT